MGPQRIPIIPSGSNEQENNATTTSGSPSNNGGCETVAAEDLQQIYDEQSPEHSYRFISTLVLGVLVIVSVVLVIGWSLSCMCGSGKIKLICTKVLIVPLVSKIDPQ